VAVDGDERTSGWQLGPAGSLLFETPPVAGAVITAGFLFDVPVRFESDQLDISGHGPLAGEVPHVPLIEVRAA
jgi:uncharacterized protein (TIGR02217 family)